ncbi:hypothetical protein ACO1O0_005619 [Amphichorda felina]
MFQLSTLTLAFTALVSFASASANDTVYVAGMGVDEVKRQLDISRYPALYTGNFDDCFAEESLFSIGRFDAGYYADNLTVVFHLNGITRVRNDSLMMHIQVDAYGETRLSQTYDPCKTNVASLCPLDTEKYIESFVALPISPYDVAGIPTIGYSIPDLDAVVRLHIFSNSTKREIGCYQAPLTNGNTLSKPGVSVPILIGSTFVTAMSSFGASIYGYSMPETRMHYAHTLSVMVIMDAFQSIFLTGAISLDWPAVLPAWWSNFGWSTGLLADKKVLQAFGRWSRNPDVDYRLGWQSVSDLARPQTQALEQQIYNLSETPTTDLVTIDTAALPLCPIKYNASNPYDCSWSGQQSMYGLPLPGTWPGFSGTLSAINIPYMDAPLIAYIWWAMLFISIPLLVMAFTIIFILIPMVLGWYNNKAFDYFIRYCTSSRENCGSFSLAIQCRMVVIAFPALVTLSTYQLSPGTPALLGWIAVFLIVFLPTSLAIAVLSAGFNKFPPPQSGRYGQIGWRRFTGPLPANTTGSADGHTDGSDEEDTTGIGDENTTGSEEEGTDGSGGENATRNGGDDTTRSGDENAARNGEENTDPGEEEGTTGSGDENTTGSGDENTTGSGYDDTTGSGDDDTARSGGNDTTRSGGETATQLDVPLNAQDHLSNLDERFIAVFGWLAARYRSDRWWFCGLYIVYHLIRGSILGGGKGWPKSQIFLLLLWEVGFLILIIKWNPFESNRNAAVMVMTSVTKIICPLLSIAFVPILGQSRMVMNIVAFVIVIVQAILVGAILVLIVLNIGSTWMSLRRYQTGYPQVISRAMDKYIEHMELRTFECAKHLQPKNFVVHGGRFVSRDSGYTTVGYTSGQGDTDSPNGGINHASPQDRGNLPPRACSSWTTWSATRLTPQDVESGRVGLWGDGVPSGPFLT